ncbi:serine/threonine-protein kinase [Actinomycetospora aeridis]|uniref:non-specific serine/threonine protein kinase n=1 Tax=Actinomycetospora aeridis TaxID=3129231 RepID=A0ABU8MZ86_9PSEU
MSLIESGTRIGESLVVERRLGEGAFAEVHRVRHEFLGWQAMKLFKRVASLPETREMLEEARLLSVMGHRNIVRLFDAGTVPTADGVRGFFTMEYVAGGSLERLIEAHRGDVPVDVVVDVVGQLAAGLAVAHEQDPPILHRDLTLANVLVGYDARGMRVRISDFGLAKRVDPFTLAASAQGTYAFMAPEVMRNEGYTCRGDVWAVGTIAYLLLTNRLPYHDGGAFSSFSLARFRRPLLPPSRWNEAVDADLDALVMAALTVDPDGRPADAGAVLAALHARRPGRPGVPAPRDVPAPSPDREERARRLVAEARELSRRAGALEHAADLLEEAVSLSPAVRAQYVDRLTRWRRGVTM